MTTKVAVAWLRKEDWARWQAVDSQLPAYDRWLVKIEGAIQEAKRKGAIIDKVEVDPDKFVAWCRANGHEVNRNTRAAYAAQISTDRSVRH
jgi:hypothetical protein